MAGDELHLAREGEIATIVINRPRKHNAMTSQMWKELARLAMAADEDNQVKVLIVRGAGGKAFASGADISEFQPSEHRTAGDEVDRLEAAGAAAAVMAALDKPTIALVQGHCIGGGCELAVACDFRFCDTTARFAITPAKMGLVYGFTATKQLVDLVGPANAKYLLLLGSQIDAQRAHRIGLVDDVFSSEEIAARTGEFAQELCTRSQVAVRGMKHIVRKVGQGQVLDDEETIRLRRDSFRSADHREGVRAFLEKRAPRFTST